MSSPQVCGHLLLQPQERHGKCDHPHYVGAMPATQPKKGEEEEPHHQVTLCQMGSHSGWGRCGTSSWPQSRAGRTHATLFPPPMSLISGNFKKRFPAPTFHLHVLMTGRGQSVCAAACCWAWPCGRCYNSNCLGERCILHGCRPTSHSDGTRGCADKLAPPYF